MSGILAFDYPPDSGNAIALVVYYAVFLVAQVVLGLRYIRGWNWSIFLGLGVFLVLVILGSVAYLKLHYAPVTGPWYSLWIFTLTAGPAFFIASVHLCMGLVLQDTRAMSRKSKIVKLSSRTYITVCLGIDFLALVLTIIGAAYAGAKSSTSPTASKPGFDLMTAAMAIQLCDLTIMLIAGTEVIVSFRNYKRSEVLRTELADTSPANFANNAIPSVTTVKRPVIVLASLLSIGVLLFTQTVVRAVDVAGGFGGPLRDAVLPNVEAILLFIAILVITALHPAVQLQKPTQDNVEK